MGLDMYFTKKYYIWTKDREKVKITGVKGVNSRKVKEISEDAGYWRKANAIHNWFVQNVQDGEDDCKEYYVSEEQMKELLDVVNKVLKASKLVKGKIQNGSRSYKDEKTGKWVSNEPIMEDGEYVEDPSVAEELLPNTEGFFFGSQAYDQYYIADLKETKKILETALKDNGKGAEFYYSSSW